MLSVVQLCSGLGYIVLNYVRSGKRARDLELGV
jgi:hypothetical protein